MNLDQLEPAIIQWAESRGIFSASTPHSQMLKTMEEVGETARAVLKKDLPEIKDGACLVWLYGAGAATAASTTFAGGAEFVWG